MEITAELKNIKLAKKRLLQNHELEQKAMRDAIRMEGYRLRSAMAEDMHSKSPGGSSFKSLSFIRRYWGYKPPRKDDPLVHPSDVAKGYSLAKAIRYGVSTNEPFTVKIGWTNDFLTKRYTLSKSWMRIAENQQKGFSRQITPEMRNAIKRYGVRLIYGGKSSTGKTKGASWLSKYDRSDYAHARFPFFLKKSTTSFKTPARPILNPFWVSQRPNVLQNIATNYKMKLSGIRTPDGAS